MNEKILEKLNNKEFAKKIIGIEAEEDVIKAFKEENIEVSEKEVKELGNIIYDMVSKLSTLPEDQLNKVSGGSDLGDFVEGAVASYMQLGEWVGNGVYHALPKMGDGVLSDESIANLATLGAVALQTYGLYKGGKWVINKGKQWWQNKKSK